MNVIATDLPEVLVFEPRVTKDDRGWFSECYNERRFVQLAGMHPSFVQDNQSSSRKGVLRGLHYQIRQPQAKLVRVVVGAVWDVVVDVRRSSPRFGRWIGTELSSENRRQIWIPVGFAHGFAVLSDRAEAIYKVTDYWAPEHERCIRWNDRKLAIDWKLEGAPVLSEKDAAGVSFAEAEVFP